MNVVLDAQLDRLLKSACAHDRSHGKVVRLEEQRRREEATSQSIALHELEVEKQNEVVAITLRTGNTPFSVSIRISVVDWIKQGTSRFDLDGVLYVREDGELATARDLADRIVATTLHAVDPRKIRLVLHGKFGESDVESSLVLRPSAKLAAFRVADAREVEVQRKCRGGKAPGNGWHKAARRLPQYRIVSAFQTAALKPSALSHLCPRDRPYSFHKDSIATAVLLICLHMVDTVVLCGREDDVPTLRALLDEGRPPSIIVTVAAEAEMLPSRNASLLIVLDSAGISDLFLKAARSCASPESIVYYLSYPSPERMKNERLSRYLRIRGCRVPRFEMLDLMNLIWSNEDVLSRMLQGTNRHVARLLKHASPEIRSDQKTVVDILASWGGALRYADASLRADEQVVLTAISEWPEAFPLAERDVRRSILTEVGLRKKEVGFESADNLFRMQSQISFPWREWIWTPLEAREQLRAFAEARCKRRVLQLCVSCEKPFTVTAMNLAGGMRWQLWCSAAMTVSEKMG